MSTIHPGKNIFVFIETENGQPKNVGYELLAPGRTLAEQSGQQLVGVVIGSHVEQCARDAICYGAEQVILVDGPEYEPYTTDAFSIALTRLIEKYSPSTVLMGATGNGRDLAPRISSRLGTGLTADCTSLEINGDTGEMVWTRPAFGGNLMAMILCPDHRPQMGTVRPGVFKKRPYDETAAGEIIREEISIAPGEIRTRLIERIKEVSESVDLEGAEIIVAAGRGIGGPQNMGIVEELADALGGTVAVSRAVVDAGWVPHAYQVGQTGKNVSPKLYIACGISGAIQHTCGISGADYVVAINKDPDAPIFELADWGIVGDLFEILPALTAAVREG